MVEGLTLEYLCTLRSYPLLYGRGSGAPCNSAARRPALVEDPSTGVSGRYASTHWQCASALKGWNSFGVHSKPTFTVGCGAKNERGCLWAFRCQSV